MDQKNEEQSGMARMNIIIDNQCINKLAIFNYDREFEQSFKELYASELAVKKERLSSNAELILGLFVKIENNHFFIQLYDMRDGFSLRFVKIIYVRKEYSI